MIPEFVTADLVDLPLPANASLMAYADDGVEYEAVADPPTEFRVLAMTRAARYPVKALARPDPDNVVALGAQCGERGIYEAWAPTAEVSDRRSVDAVYQL